MLRNFFFIIVLLPITLFSQYKITVKVENIKEAKGDVCVALYNDSKTFLKLENVYKSEKTKALLKETTLFFDNIPEGEYAIAIFHDENSNEELDTNFFGIPKEDVAFSYGKLKTFGPPSYKECAFKVNADKEVLISIN
ncbi:DUF2141 domain-containing protein [Cellulophaga sp. HaHaR_3_176]|uniref:DUF2141 domain-containing protein n=1 Tax=Cellulophaga sp. HaHaR_3_176 TaxID=1942464 RepID=UPI001C1FC1C2|nr:DUF2141 domain-containing protein [Cellulophaga sp. HaHaR_3_176]QWX83834.1 DUF2141 domain-containing protein [Cellulophaga sp. HaHaR_3_176]